MSVVTQPGQRCGHELRRGAQFCSVCGRPAADDTRRTGLVDQEQVPAAAPEAAAIRLVPARPELDGLTSPATMTAGPSERPSGGGAGSGPRRGWPDPSPAPGGAMPRHGGTTPRQGRRPPSRWPLAAGAVALLAAGGAAAAVFTGQPVHHSHAVAGTSRTVPPPSRSNRCPPQPPPPPQPTVITIGAATGCGESGRASRAECHGPQFHRERGQQRQPVRAGLEPGPAGLRKRCRSAPAPALPARQPSRAFRAVRADASGADRRLAGLGHGGSGFCPMGSG